MSTKKLHTFEEWANLSKHRWSIDIIKEMIANEDRCNQNDIRELKLLLLEYENS